MKMRFRRLNGTSYEAEVVQISNHVWSNGKTYSLYKMCKNPQCDKDMYFVIDHNSGDEQSFDTYDSIGDLMFDLYWRPYFNESLTEEGYTLDDIVDMVKNKDERFTTWYVKIFRERRELEKLCKEGLSFEEALARVKGEAA